jgi:cytochrome P450
MMIQAADPAAMPAADIGPGALTFMVVGMGSVATLTAWCFYRILTTKQHFDPDGTGPAHTPVPGRAEQPEEDR